MNRAPDLSPSSGPLALAQALVRRASVTPVDAGAMDVLEGTLTRLGFRCRRLLYGGIHNLYARWGQSSPNLCFAGHTDVVPPGPPDAWTRDPFGAVVEEGVLYGRGVADMKGAIAAFISAAASLLERAPPQGSLSLLITGDEEGEAVNGTRRVIETLVSEGERIDHCIVGEPTSAFELGDTVKIGRRGSVNARIIVEGSEGHVAYPDRAANPAPILVEILHRLAAAGLDEGFSGFQPSNLEITDISIGNPATNVIPARAVGRVNIRFNPAHTGAGLLEWIRETAEAAAPDFAGSVRVEGAVSGEAFLTREGPFTELVVEAVAGVTGRRPELSTSGGTSDARFIRALCPVVELGLVGASMHKVDEHAPVQEIEDLARIYGAILESYFFRV